MPQKKTGKRVVKRQDVLTTVQKKEREFLKTPTALSALLVKEVKLIKQKQIQLKKSIDQLATQIANFEKRPQTNTKLNSREKKLFQTYQANIKAKSLLAKQLESTKQLLRTAIDQQVKLMAFGKYINQFEREWQKQTTKVIPLKKPKPAEQLTEQLQPNESGIENISVNRTAEVIS